MWTVLGPLLIDLAREWIKDGKPSKANVKVAAEALLSQLENTEAWDMEVLGKNMVIQGLALQKMARNLKGNAPASDYKVQPLRPTSAGDVDNQIK